MMGTPGIESLMKLEECVNYLLKKNFFFEVFLFCDNFRLIEELGKP